MSEEDSILVLCLYAPISDTMVSVHMSWEKKGGKLQN